MRDLFDTALTFLQAMWASDLATAISLLAPDWKCTLPRSMAKEGARSAPAAKTVDTPNAQSGPRIASRHRSHSRCEQLVEVMSKFIQGIRFKVIPMRDARSVTHIGNLWLRRLL
jgi:hypothetical protein